MEEEITGLIRGDGHGKVVLQCMENVWLQMNYPLCLSFARSGFVLSFEGREVV